MEIRHIIKESQPGFFNEDILLFRAEWDGRCANRAVSKSMVSDLGEEYVNFIWYGLDLMVAKPIRLAE